MMTAVDEDVKDSDWVEAEEDDKDPDWADSEADVKDSNWVETDGNDKKTDDKVADWVERLRSDGNISLQTPEECVAGIEAWASPPARIFLVRGPEYLISKVKIPAGNCLLKSLAFDWLKSSSKIHRILQHPNGRVHAAMREVCDSAGNAATPFFWAFNLQVPSKENYSAIAYFVSFDPIVDGSLIGRFVRGDDDFRNSRLKLIANVVNGPWIVKTAVGEQAICILGRSVSCKYHQGDNFIEVDVDIGASILANAIVHLALGYVSTLTVDLAFLIESQTEEELPEQLLGTVRFGNLDPASAVSVDVEEEKDEQLKEEDDDEEDEFEDAVEAATEPAPASLPGRWWKSFSTYINGEEPQSKTRNGSDSSSEEG